MRRYLDKDLEGMNAAENSDSEVEEEAQSQARPFPVKFYTFTQHMSIS